MSKGVCRVMYGVGRMPGRKSVFLYRAANQTVTPIAQFKNEAEAWEFMEFIDSLVLYDQSKVGGDWHGWAVVD